MLEAEVVMRPMRAFTLTENLLPEIAYPAYVSPKLDGIRCVIRRGFPVSRTLKLIPNIRIRKILSCCPEGLDGELVVGDPTDKDVFSKTQSIVMSLEGDINDLKFHVFDRWNQPDIFFEARHNGLKIVMDHMINHRKHDWLVHVEQQHVRNLDELLFWEAHYRSRGYEGIMIRSPVANYKFGDSRFSTGELMKFKRWRDAEAKIVGYKEGNTNVSPPELDDLGYIHRPVLTSNTVGRDTLGAFICELPNGVRFDVGNGMTEEYKAELWAQRDTLIGKWITFKYQGLFSNGKPRFQTFKGFRDTIDFQYEQE